MCFVESALWASEIKLSFKWNQRVAFICCAWRAPDEWNRRLRAQSWRTISNQHQQWRRQEGERGRRTRRRRPEEAAAASVRQRDSEPARQRESETWKLGGNDWLRRVWFSVLDRPRRSGTGALLPNARNANWFARSFARLRVTRSLDGEPVFVSRQRTRAEARRKWRRAPSLSQSHSGKSLHCACERHRDCSAPPTR